MKIKNPNLRHCTARVHLDLLRESTMSPTHHRDLQWRTERVDCRGWNTTKREKSRWYIIKKILLYLFYVWTVKWNQKQIMKNSSWLSRKTTWDPQKKVFKNKTEIGVLNTNFFSKICEFWFTNTKIRFENGVPKRA